MNSLKDTMDDGDKFLIVMIIVVALVVVVDVFRNNLGAWFSENGVWIFITIFVVVLLVISFYFKFWRPTEREVEEENLEEKKNLKTGMMRKVLKFPRLLTEKTQSSQN